MKKITLSTLIISMFFMLPNVAKSQSYSFTLIDDGNYDFTLAAVTGFDSGAFAPLTQSYGFTVVVPDGVTITFNTYAPAGTAGTVSPIPGTSVAGFDPSMSDKDLYLVTTDTSGATFDAHGTGETINLVSFTVNGMPTTGELTVLDNNSTLAMAPGLMGSLNSFIQADVTDNAMVDFADEFIGLTGITSYSFATLDREDVLAVSKISLFPNPTADVINIRTNNDITYSIFNILGQSVKLDGTLDNNNVKSINLSHLPDGIYVLKTEDVNNRSSSFKIIKKE